LRYNELYEEMMLINVLNFEMASCRN